MANELSSTEFWVVQFRLVREVTQASLVQMRSVQFCGVVDSSSCVCQLNSLNKEEKKRKKVVVVAAADDNADEDAKCWC